MAAWQWDVVASVLGVNRSAKTKATAARGWQATPIEVQSGGTYHLTSKGKWTVEANSPAVDADGDAAGRGKLLAVIFSNYQLGKVFEIGADGSFTADRDGQLYLRCQDLFGELADNQGEMTVQIKREK